MRDILHDFLKEECDFDTCVILINSILDLMNKETQSQHDEFFFNRFNIYIDGDAGKVKIEDDINFGDEYTLLVDYHIFLKVLENKKKRTFTIMGDTKINSLAAGVLIKQHR